jgi:hypothetical protein
MSKAPEMLGKIAREVPYVNRSDAMPLTPEQIDILEKLGPSNVRNRLEYARVAGTSVLPGLRSHDDVEEWLSQKDRQASKLQADTLRYAKAAFWGTVVTIGVTVVVAILK